MVCWRISRPSEPRFWPTPADRASVSGIAQPSANGVPNTIVNSFNRNFPKRNDGSANTLSFVTSPDTVMALALAGRLDFDPTTETITAPDGSEVLLDAPVGEVLPDKGYDVGENTFTPPPADGSDVAVEVSPTSERLQLLQPFPAWDGNDYFDLPILMKAKGKCTTDHISAAGKWLAYRGHLENISGNLFLGVVSAFDRPVGEGVDFRDGSPDTLPNLARKYGEAGIRWVAIGDRNYGEGSSREHAAMEPRFRGGVVILARSFARIHETNLKKQGLLPLTFADPDTYDLIEEGDRINVLGLPPKPGHNVRCEIVKPDGTVSRSRACTRSATSRSNGSGPARRSTSYVARSPRAGPEWTSPRHCAPRDPHAPSPTTRSTTQPSPQSSTTPASRRVAATANPGVSRSSRTSRFAATLPT